MGFHRFNALWVCTVKCLLLAIQLIKFTDAQNTPAVPPFLSLLSNRIQSTSMQQEICGKLDEQQLYNREKEVAFNEYPWLGRISYTNSDGDRVFRCLGTLFNSRYLIAPAHCVLNTGTLEAYSVVFGDWNATDDIVNGDCNAIGECAPPPQEYELSEIAVHPNYTESKRDNDIAVLKLTEEVRYTDYVQPICLLPPVEYNGRNYVAERLECVGFPAKSLFSNAKVKQKAIVHTTSIKHCNRIHNDRFKVSSNQICGYVKSEVNFMSGSALMGVNTIDGEPRNFYLIGLVTAGSPEKNHEVPDLFMCIAPYKNWILENSS